MSIEGLWMRINQGRGMQVKAARQVTRILKDTRGDNDGSDQRFGRESSSKVDEVRRLKRTLT